jgi:hypothetical protein
MYCMITRMSLALRRATNTPISTTMHKQWPMISVLLQHMHLLFFLYVSPVVRRTMRTETQTAPAAAAHAPTWAQLRSALALTPSQTRLSETLWLPQSLLLQVHPLQQPSQRHQRHQQLQLQQQHLHGLVACCVCAACAAAAARLLRQQHCCHLMLLAFCCCCCRLLLLLCVPSELRRWIGGGGALPPCCEQGR